MLTFDKEMELFYIMNNCFAARTIKKNNRNNRKIVWLPARLFVIFKHLLYYNIRYIHLTACACVKQSNSCLMYFPETKLNRQVGIATAFNYSKTMRIKCVFFYWKQCELDLFLSSKKDRVVLTCTTVPQIWRKKKI